jgi:hypothetical protein
MTKKDSGNPDKFTWKPDDIEWEDGETSGSTAPKPATAKGEPSKSWLGKLNDKINRDVGNNG